jgi:hypothetical protein
MTLLILIFRSLVQIKSHAQKVLKRLEAGENVFRRLEENYNVIDSLIVQAAKQRDALIASSSAPKSVSAAAKRKRVTKRPPATQQQQAPTVSSGFCQNRSLLGSFGSDTTTIDADAGRGAVIAAAALCQLSSLGWDQKHQANASLQKSC